MVWWGFIPKCDTHKIDLSYQWPTEKIQREEEREKEEKEDRTYQIFKVVASLTYLLTTPQHSLAKLDTHTVTRVVWDLVRLPFAHHAGDDSHPIFERAEAVVRFRNNYLLKESEYEKTAMRQKVLKTKLIHVKLC